MDEIQKIHLINVNTFIVNVLYLESRMIGDYLVRFREHFSSKEVNEQTKKLLQPSKRILDSIFFVFHLYIVLKYEVPVFDLYINYFID